MTLDACDTCPDDPAPSLVTAPVPIPSNVKLGPDEDDDGFPATATIERFNLTVDRRQGAQGIHVTPAPDRTVPIDPCDACPDEPATSRASSPTPLATGVHFGPDEDQDDIPATIVLERETVTIDRRVGHTPIAFTPATNDTQPLDPDDADAANPAPSTFGPISVPMFAQHGGDEDGDLVPAHATVTWLDVTIDRRTDADETLTLEQRTTTTTLDEDDDRDDPLPFDSHDADADGVPDEAEAWVCLVEDQNRDEDGTCEDTDQDGFGDDYHPPAKAPNPWEMT